MNFIQSCVRARKICRALRENRARPKSPRARRRTILISSTMSSGTEGFSSRLSSNSNMSGAAAMRLAFAFASTSASTDATGCPQRSTTRDSFCGSIRHIPDFTLLLAIPLLSRRGSLLLLLSVIFLDEGSPFKVTKVFPGCHMGYCPQVSAKRFLQLFQRDVGQLNLASPNSTWAPRRFRRNCVPR